MSVTIQEVVARGPVIPVLVINELAHAIPLAQALCRGGLSVLEITLRTPVALTAIRQIIAAVPEAIVGAGTVLTYDHAQAAVDAGSQFLVSPGTTPALLKAVAQQQVPLLPGVSTASEVMQLLEAGFDHLKFFPAEAAGGIPLLKGWGGPLPQATFCPTGGINLEKAKAYLALKNVACVGGSWMAPSALVAAESWLEIEQLAAAAVALRATE